MVCTDGLVFQTIEEQKAFNIYSYLQFTVLVIGLQSIPITLLCIFCAHFDHHFRENLIGRSMWHPL